MNNDLRANVIAFLDALDLTSSMDCYDVRNRVNKFRGSPLLVPLGAVQIHDGASKICLLFKNLPFVIKYDTDGYGEATQEVTIYQAAVAAGLSYFFPKTELFYEHNGLSFVLQEKIDYCVSDAECDAEYKRFIKRVTKTPTDHIYRKMQNDFNKAGRDYRRHLDEHWAKMVISLYGKKAAKALCKFVIAHNINDLHTSNIGYKNFRPIILDFSGYHR